MTIRMFPAGTSGIEKFPSLSVSPRMDHSTESGSSGVRAGLPGRASSPAGTIKTTAPDTGAREPPASSTRPSTVAVKDGCPGPFGGAELGGTELGGAAWADGPTASNPASTPTSVHATGPLN